VSRDNTLWLLAGGLLLYTLVIILVSVMLPGNEKLYALIAGILGNFSGALFMYLRMGGPPSSPPPVTP
jgi:hypothetical protein